MRLFVALPLPASQRLRLAETAARLRAELPPARWVPAANLHLTLRFLGPTDPDRLAGLEPVLADCFELRAPFTLRLHGGGCFPPNRPGRVAWVGFEPCPALMDLQRVVAAAVEAFLEMPAESRSFHPHLTLARPRRPWPRASVARFEESLAGPHGDAFGVAEGHLMRSRLGPGGARHDSIGVYPLAAGDSHGV